MFKDNFKYYKSRNPLPDLTNVIDFNCPDISKVKNIKAHFTSDTCEKKFGLKCSKDWKIYELLNIPGLIFIQNPFTTSGHHYWILKCLRDYSKKPNKLNLDAHNILSNHETWWDICFRSNNNNRAANLLPKLRWATLGYHHDWDTKVYSENSKTPMPIELIELTQFLARVLNFSKFRAEAAIINYYRMNSTLAGHTDCSEPNIEAPLFSISFGQTAIFLIGGLSQKNPADALFLQSGDILVMAGSSRLRYHGVPKILSSQLCPWDTNETETNESDWICAKKYLAEARININVRQVLKDNQLTLS
ncbi:PREDICTED: DNA oxidative demethylase ALKBH1 [Polistes dominula]|uniref:DNA oxidative demethylase ALKBH1 n=1 Tax=Polistes dominula TaxID=743375 RepID=A0ABM1IFS4_POLDO|nr:PREDICTED: DNA oxidative demethylase ALKBH1 [Polistes dominula]